MKKILISILVGLLVFPLWGGEGSGFKTEEEQKAKKAENAKRAQAFILLAKKAINEKKLRTAFDYYLLAAKHGNADAQAVVGNCYYNGSWGVEKDPEKGVKWLRKAAHQGNNAAQAQLSRALGSGKGVNRKKPRKSAKWNKKSQF